MQTAAPGSGMLAAFPFTNAEQPFPLASTEPFTPLADAVTLTARSMNQPRSPLMEAFFSRRNVDVLQNRLRATIQKQTGYSIARQSDTELEVVMRRAYEEHASNTLDGVEAEVQRLNDIVLRSAVPVVASGVAAYLAYLRDASRIPEPLPRGTQTSVKGTKTFELFRGL